MRILCLDQFSDLGGAQLCLVDLVGELSKGGFEFHVAAPGNGPLIARLRGLGVPVRGLEIHRYSRGHKTFSDALHFMADLRPLARRIRVLAAETDGWNHTSFITDRFAIPKTGEWSIRYS